MSCQDEFGDALTWETKEGQEIAYHDLEDSHLRNVIRHMQRQSAGANNALIYVNGEQAEYALQDALSHIESELDDLLQECDRRGWSRTYALGAAE